MKNYSLIVALLVLFIVSVGYAEETIESDGVVTVEAGVEVEPTLLKHYSPLIAGFGNLVPGLGYFLIDEPWWGAGELALIAGGTALTIIGIDKEMNYYDPMIEIIAGMSIIVVTGAVGLIHAPLLAIHKNNQQKVALDLSPGLGLNSEGVAYPTVQLTLSF